MRVADEIIQGLTARPRTLPPKLFYDELGSTLFGAITKLPWYTPTRCEEEVLRVRAADLGAAIGPGAVIVEPGAGLCEKFAWILPALEQPRAFVPMDIDGDTLRIAAGRLQRAFPSLAVDPRVVDFTRDLPWPDVDAGVRQVVFYPGSTLGNLDHAAAEAFLRKLASHLRPGDKLVLGVDLVKPEPVLVEAYDDPIGVTAAFNRNILVAIRQHVETDLDPRHFDHRAVWNPEVARIEMHLVARTAHRAHVEGHAIDFAEGESIHTESSHKYDRDRLEALAAVTGFEPEVLWTDHKGWFAVTVWRRT